MTDLAAKLAELASKWRRTPALLAADAAADDLATFVDDNLAAILTALRASRPEPAADAVEAAWRAYEAAVGRIVRYRGFADPQDRKEGIRAALSALSALPRPAESDAVERAARTWTVLHGEDWDELGPAWQASRLDLFAKVLRAAALPRPEADEGTVRMKVEAMVAVMRKYKDTGWGTEGDGYAAGMLDAAKWLTDALDESAALAAVQEPDHA